MPNWCENELHCVGPKEDLDEIADLWGADEGVFQAVKPMPEGFDLHETGANPKWYSWRNENWGTKWEPSEEVLDRTSEGSLDISFQTAWAPPREIIVAIGQKFKKVKFILKYWEGGAAFKGTFIVEKGYTVKDVTTDYHGTRGG